MDASLLPGALQHAVMAGTERQQQALTTPVTLSGRQGCLRFQGEHLLTARGALAEVTVAPLQAVLEQLGNRRSWGQVMGWNQSQW